MEKEREREREREVCKFGTKKRDRRTVWTSV